MLPSIAFVSVLGLECLDGFDTSLPGGVVVGVVPAQQSLDRHCRDGCFPGEVSGMRKVCHWYREDLRLCALLFVLEPVAGGCAFEYLHHKKDCDVCIRWRGWNSRPPGAEFAPCLGGEVVPEGLAETRACPFAMHLHNLQRHGHAEVASQRGLQQKGPAAFAVRLLKPSFAGCSPVRIASCRRGAPVY
eukprot:CAMPEP_0203841642 /NCGR_PEP_ID=MMETSP0359-20131031/1518_1 /ASSEMBLY_ACC=CAM_ASM_000338 /TAXON_ID=268821 /ORGANISM="Scrippsiella Hangoei, Strain SHTV-5" /LENGTH=187 /DNA_ID=CAMNT_0050756099 /DNA_START=1 /DNA_END=561 /DNA_ORIENTATION=-